ncbi:hypothetical protein [Moraxella bovis]|uniref:Uncharacterized protein n=1 Tax=Moraxella bovis TaxID=476 RepID=A0AAQ2Q2I7_MORBO|nr:hypothetical protein [Moraxella bovis]AWY21032.1 hypothetical protein DQF64_11415 [Moraxella bovis]OOR90279.1 hypothetical protein B0182_05185 [Moraxella bovis]UYZ76302.1 hypothetical protein LP093_02985 [Moraxella bovis]UYZ77746.1 hypothetical protein LP115_10820 [Moraxella bovis]UYZ86232.1 hypothetical protein LP094_10870 [Moraxella bovis]
MSQIGKPIIRDNHDKSLKIIIWCAGILGMIVFGTMIFIALTEQAISIGGVRGARTTYHEGVEAIKQTYFLSACFMLSLGSGFWYFRYRRLIWLILFLCWIIFWFLCICIMCVKYGIITKILTKDSHAIINQIR